jgi:hypothetical protein
MQPLEVFFQDLARIVDHLLLLRSIEPPQAAWLAQYHKTTPEP